MTAIVDQCVHCFLKHPLFISNDDIRCIQFQHSFQTVVTVDDTAIQIVQVRCCVPTAIEHNHRAEIRRDNRNNIQNHPFRTVAGEAECLYNFQTLEQLDTLLSGIQTTQFCFQLCGQFIQINFTKQCFDGFCAHLCIKFIAVFFSIRDIFLFGQQLLFRQISVARIQYNVLGEVQDFFQTLLRNFQHLSDSGRGTFEVPDMGNGCSQFDMTHSFPTYFRTCNFYAAAVADFPFKTNFLKLAAVTLPVLGWPEDSLAVQTVSFRFLCPIVNGFRAFYCAIRPFPDAFRGSEPDFNGFKSIKFQTVTS